MISKEGLKALARYAPILQAKDFSWSDLGAPADHLPWHAYGDVADSFVADAYKFEWVSGAFDWPEWSRTMEAQLLRTDPVALAGADATQLAKLLTCAVRSDRFCEGTLAADYESGLLERIAMRAQALAASAS